MIIRQKFIRKKIDSVEGEDYWAYLRKGSIAFNAKKYKQAENYFRKGCEKAVSYEGTSVFDDFYQNCNAHTAMELFAKACEPNPESFWDEPNPNSEYISCMQIGDIYYKGSKELQIKRNIPLAKNFYKKTCENPATSGEDGGARSAYMFGYLHCKELGNLYYSENNFVEAKKWWIKAIIGEYYAFGTMGDLKCSETDTIKEICEKHPFFERHYISIRAGYFQEAEKYYKGYIVEEKGGEFDKNNNWIPKTTHIPHEKDYNKAFILASIGCDDFADSKSCYLLAKAYTEGKGTKQDSNLAQHYLKKGNKCEARKLLNEYREYEGSVGGEDKTLFELFEKACKLDSEISVTCDAILKEKGIK